MYAAAVMACLLDAMCQYSYCSILSRKRYERLEVGPGNCTTRVK